MQWAEERAVILDAPDWESLDSAKLGFLDEAVADKRVVFLGEPDHYISEKYRYRLILIRDLFEKGFRYVGMEMGLSDGMRVDQYLETGDLAYLDRVSIYGYLGDVRVDRDDVPPLFHAQAFFDDFVDEERWFLQQLRMLNESLEPGEDRLHWFGFDIDPLPGGGYAEATSLLEPLGSETVLDEIRARLVRIPGESFTEEADRLEDLLGFLAANEEQIAVVDDLRAVVQNLVDSLRFRELAYREPLGQHWDEGLQYREEALIDRLDEGWLPCRRAPSSF